MTTHCPLALLREAIYPSNMQAYRAEATLSEDGTVTLRDIPFRRGEAVEIIVLSAVPAAPPACYSLRGTPVSLIAPTQPVAADDWDSLK